MIYGNTKLKENVKKERFAGRLKLKDIFNKKDTQKIRNKKTLKAFKEYGYSQSKIGRELDLHYSTISRIIDKERSRAPR